MERSKYKLLVYRILRIAGISIMNFMLVLSLILVLQYLKVEVFFRETNDPFSGEFLYNPYKDFNPETLKANFHAHSKDGLFANNGDNSADKVYNHYKEAGYDLASLSNYQRITNDPEEENYIPVYEHGYSVKKTHHLVLNGTRTTFFDFSLFQNFHMKQQVINKLKQNSGYIALAHPELLDAYKKEDMKYLKGYDFIEVFNNYKLSSEIWDAALTSGYPAWILANDDCHDITRTNIPFCSWTRIGSESKSKKDVLDALERGCHYGYRHKDHIETNFLDSCIVKDSEIRVYFKHPADRILFRADNGVIRKSVGNQSFASYHIDDADSYVRIEAETEKGLLYLNPVIRYNGYQLSYNNGFGLVNTTLTILVRALILVFGIALFTMLLLVNGRARQVAGLFRLRGRQIPSFT